MKNNAKKAFWGVLLLLTAAALILYGAGFGAEAFGMPMHKLILSFVLIAWLFSKIFFGDSPRERFKIFFPLAFLFMLLEKEISHWASLPDENIVNNWFVIMAALIANSAIGLLIPNRYKKKHSNTFSNATHYFDAAESESCSVYNRMGNSTVYYQNAELADSSRTIELHVSNKMGNISVYVPENWVVIDEVNNNMGNVEIRESSGGGLTLVLKGSNKMGNIEVIS